MSWCFNKPMCVHLESGRPMEPEMAILAENRSSVPCAQETVFGLVVGFTRLLDVSRPRIQLVNRTWLISKYVPIFHASARFAPKLRPPSDPLRPTVSPIQFESWWIAMSPTEHYHPSDLMSCSTFFSTLTHQAVAFTSGFLIPLVVSLFHPGKSRPPKRTSQPKKCWLWRRWNMGCMLGCMLGCM